ncbi:MAG: 4-alpha-glucanotransferase [Gemmataceae bacterium]
MVPVEYEVVNATKRWLLEIAFSRFRASNATVLQEPYRKFCVSVDWLADFALFAALKDRFSQRPWWEWDRALALREPTALEKAKQELASEIEFHQFTQFLFFRQWEAVRQHALSRGVRLLGDLPISLMGTAAPHYSHEPHRIRTISLPEPNPLR